MTRSKIYIAKNLQNIKDILLSKTDNAIVKIFETDDFLIEDAKAVAKEAYIKEERVKYIFIVAKSFNLYAQNSLLKLLEESPKKTIFIIISNSKSNFLPTIRSRLPIETIEKEKRERIVEIDLLKMSLGDIFNFVKKYQRASKAELKEMIQDIFYIATHSYNINFTEDEIETFSTALKLAELNTRAHFLLSMILITILDRKKR